MSSEEDFIVVSQKIIGLESFRMNQFLPVSIITPVFNGELYLRDFLLNISKQTFKDFELIFVDDGSTDKSAEIVTSFMVHDARIKLLEQKHFGAARARNYGITKAKGKYLLFLDSDDLFEETFIERMYNTAISDGSEIVVSGYSKVDFNTGKLIAKSLPRSGIYLQNELTRTLFQRTNPAPWNKLFSKDLIERENLKFQDLKTCNDLSFVFIALSKASKISFINQSLVLYRVNVPRSISSGRGFYSENLIKAVLCVMKSLQDANVFFKYKGSLLSSLSSSIIYELGNCSTIARKLEFLFNCINQFGPVILFSILKTVVLRGIRKVKLFLQSIT